MARPARWRPSAGMDGVRCSAGVPDEPCVVVNPFARQRRKRDIRRRVATPPDAPERCGIFGCGQPTTAFARTGLNRLYCRRHADHFDRHGSYAKASLPAAVVNPYRRAAYDWLLAHASDAVVMQAIADTERLYRRAGPHIEAFRLAGKSPKERALAAWARLREAGISPILPLAAWLAIELRLRDDAEADRSVEYRRVQVAKIVHRMASGSHRRWEQEGFNGKVRVVELHKYPASRGLVLRHIGEAAEQVSAGLVEVHLDAIWAATRAAVAADELVRPHPVTAGTRHRGVG